MLGQKRSLVLINTRELSRVPSIGESTLYTSSIQSMHAFYLACPKYYELYIRVIILYDI